MGHIAFISHVLQLAHSPFACVTVVTLILIQ